MNFLKLEREQWLALARLNESPDFQSLLEAFKASLAQADRQNRIREGVQLHWSQGMSVLLAEIIELPAMARKTLEAKQPQR